MRYTTNNISTLNHVNQYIWSDVGLLLKYYRVLTNLCRMSKTTEPYTKFHFIIKLLKCTLYNRVCTGLIVARGARGGEKGGGRESPGPVPSLINITNN